MILDLTHKAARDALPEESDPLLQSLLLQARKALRQAAAGPVNVIPFPVDRIVRIHRNTGPAVEALPGDNHAR